MPQPKTCLAKPKFSGANWDKVIPHIHTYIHTYRQYSCEGGTVHYNIVLNSRRRLVSVTEDRGLKMNPERI